MDVSLQRKQLYILQKKNEQGLQEKNSGTLLQREWNKRIRNTDRKD
jgi:hypothetical protein